MPVALLTIELGFVRCGPSEFTVTGNIKNWDIIDQLHKIEIPTLLINAEYDEATDLVEWPYFNKVPNVKWACIMDASHSAHWEQRERYMATVEGFLRN